MILMPPQPQRGKYRSLVIQTLWLWQRALSTCPWIFTRLIKTFIIASITQFVILQASLDRGGSNDDDRDEDHRRDRRDDRDERRNRYHDRQQDQGLASLLSKPDVLAAVNLIGQLGSLGGGFGGGMGGFGQVR